MYHVSREIRFCYGHRLINHTGKCRFLHGHNGRALVTVAAEKLDGMGMVIDFSEIRRRLETWIMDHLDHSMLLHSDDPALPFLQQQRERVFVMQVNPTAENIARLLFEAAQELGLPVVEVVFWETDDCCAGFRGTKEQSRS